MRVSVVIPSYNVASYLPQALESVHAQTRPVDEVIVVDDGSTDGSTEVARRHGAVCVRTPVNGGPAAARNLGTRAASGDVVAYLDGDDFWEPTHCAETVGLLERFPEAAVAFGRVRKIGGETRAPDPELDLPAGTPTDALLSLVVYNTVPQSGAVVRRAAVLEAGGYDERMRYSEDYDLWLRLARRHPFVCTQEITTNYRVHPAQATQAVEKLMRGGWEARRRLWESYAGAPAEERARVAAALSRAWELDLRLAWRNCDRAMLDVVLAQRDVVPDSAASFERWDRRARRFWSFWVPAIAVWDRLPQGTKNALKTPVRALRGA
ncbi:MAG: glycosyltransferase family 2 protein [Gemmatimonadaceae bacterium]